jgi:hypothetical protein
MRQSRHQDIKTSGVVPLLAPIVPQAKILIRWRILDLQLANGTGYRLNSLVGNARFPAGLSKLRGMPRLETKELGAPEGQARGAPHGIGIDADWLSDLDSTTFIHAGFPGMPR